ncbi:MAG: hypothetical protein WAN35_09695 [Terracidiphilus sp.]
MSSEINEQVDAIDFEIIAERILTVKIEDRSFNVIVQFGKPLPHSKGDWCCSYRIKGLGDDIYFCAWGIDAVQALQLAMFAVGATLNTYKKKMELTFLDENHLGFPSNLIEATGHCPYCKSGEIE